MLLTSNDNIVLDNATKSLKEHDHIWFLGKLIGNSNGVVIAERPSVLVSSIGCLACSSGPIMSNVEQKSLEDEVVKNIKRLFKYILYPIVLFK